MNARNLPRWAAITTIASVSMLALAVCTPDSRNPTGPGSSASPTLTEAAADAGSLTVRVATAGGGQDTDGYVVTVDGGAATQPVGSDGSVTFDGLSAGVHAVALASVAAHCAAAENPRTASITAGSTTETAFAVTCPPSAPAGSHVLVGAGNIASCNWDADEATAKLVDAAVARDPAALVLVAGDNAYDAATAAELTGCFGPTWGRHKDRIYAALGNRDYRTDANPSWDYFGDRAGPRGKGYYSFDVGESWHVIVLNDNWGDGGPGGGAGSTQDKWLVADLAANTKPCTIAIWHQPYVASGWSVSNSRRNFWDRLYEAGAEIVFNAHADHYERFAPQSSDLTRDDGYGVREFVVGTGGTPPAGLSTRRANSEASKGNTNGVLRLVLGPGTYSWEFMAVGQTYTDVGSGTCHPPARGSIAVTTTTIGADTDPDGYSITLDGVRAQTIAANGSFTYTDVPGGSRKVRLAGAADHCTVDDASQTASVTGDNTATIAFHITCGPPPPGNLTVTAQTTGWDLDPDGYAVTIDGDPATAQATASNGSVTFTGLSVGTHTVQLSSIADNCTTTSNPRSASIASGETASTTFAVSCQPTPGFGNLAVRVATSGGGTDADGYVVTVVGGAGQPVGMNGTVTFTNLGSGPQSVALTGLASHCTVAESPRTVTVLKDATVETEFAVNCAAPSVGSYVLVGAGDIASCSWEADEATAKLVDGVVARDPAATVFIAGDNVYDAATASDLANCFGPTWGRHKDRMYVAMGNHDYKIDPNPSWDYFGARAGPRGKGYYSFDLGDYWHVIVLNDNWGDGGPGGGAGTAQDKWLVADLAANTKPCTIAIWHQPYVASGWVTNMGRKNFWSRLYAANAELIVNGHAHRYERMAPMNPDLVRDDARGLRQFIVATGGTPIEGIGTRAANSEITGKANGVFKLVLGPGTFTWEFIPVPGQTFTDSGSGTCR